MATKTTTKKTARKPAAKPVAPPAPPTSKRDAIIALLNRPGGATLDELMTTTGWQAHSVRGFISGTLRKKLGLTITSAKNARGEQNYRITN
jgi:Protein of unknown function (DUF3489)